MAEVSTVAGSVDVGELGPTLMHEHIFVLTPEVQANHPQDWDEEVRVADAVRRLRQLRERGVRSIVDPTVIGLGRDIPRIQRVCAEIDLNVVVATGLYTYNDVPLYFSMRGPGRPLDGDEPMVEMFVGDIEQGIAGTGVRAGVLKCATESQGVTEGVERVLRACAQAHRRTGVPLMTHTHAASRRGLDQQRIFREEGVDLSRVVLGHCGDTTDIAYLEALAAAGSYLGMDRFGLDLILSTQERVDTLVAMCERGHADRMVLAHDASCWIDWIDPVDEALRQAAVPNWHYLHISDDVLPVLRERGVSEAQIEQMLVGNPRDIFSRQGGY